MSKRFVIVALASSLLAWSAAAQTSANSQTSVSGSSQTSVSADHNTANVDSNSSVAASENVNASRNDEHDNQQPKRNPDNDRDTGKGKHSSTTGSHSGSNSSSGNAAQDSLNLAGGTTINAVLNKSVDARKAKPGDEVDAKVANDVKSDGKVVIPRDSRIVGHVTEAKPKAKDEANGESSLGIVFDRAVLKNGHEVPVHATIQALAAAQNNASAAMAEPIGMPTGGRARSGGGLVGGVGSAAGEAAGVAGEVGRDTATVVNTSTNAAGSAAGSVGHGASAAGQLTSGSSGVIGLKGLQLSSEASNASQGSVITSAGKTVKLDSGMQMLLRVAAQ